MNDLYADIGFQSLNHHGESLCGDHVEIVNDNGSTVTVVLADGLGSGVKANILSTLTSKILSTLIHADLSVEAAVSTVAATLPVCSVRGLAYSTFTIIYIKNNEYAEIIQYDNPKVFILRNGENYDYPTEEIMIGDKKILKSKIYLEENDLFFAMSDGCQHAGIGGKLNFGWKRENIIRFMEPLECAGYNAKTLATILVDECNKLYGGKPGDDVTACAIRIRKRNPVNLLFGPPSNRDDGNKMMALFFSKEGKHIVCGGTTASLAANYLGKKLVTSLEFGENGVPPIAKIDGVDLVTEGVITMSRVLEYAKDFVSDNKEYEAWSMGRDGASRIAQLLFEEATDINFYVGRAINPAHQNPDLPINFNIKMNLVKELSDCLQKMGKHIVVSYF
ncbi:MAG: SpoIIE family protein phosphatase [Clostridia bacterium]|nr:SpoIIE family protein phosphatase [Clostridia bacterium]